MSRLEDFVEAARERIATGSYGVLDEPLTPRGRLSQAIMRPDAVIAELKPKSPSHGQLLEGPVQAVIDDIVRGGACALSVLTDSDHFDGSVHLLRQAHAMGVPTMMKDFVIDTVQIDAAAHAGASAVLLIERILEPAQREALIEAAHTAGLEVLLEVFDRDDWQAARDSAADIIGVNARDLETLQMDAAAQLDLIQEASGTDRPVVALSGIRRRHDRLAMVDAGAQAVLVGTSLMRHPDRRLALMALRRPLAKVCGLTHPEDVELAAAAGADLAGFVVGAPDSPRDLEPDAAQRLMAYAHGRGVAPVLVTNMRDVASIALWAKACRPAYVQAPPTDGLAERLHAIGTRLLATASPDDAPPAGDGIIIDTPSPIGGGSGETHDWSATARLCDAAPDTLTLVAGGLHAGNVHDALAVSRAWGADASSRLEARPGRKDPEAVRGFVAAVHGEGNVDAD